MRERIRPGHQLAAYVRARDHVWATSTRADGTRYTRSPLGLDYTLQPNPYLETG